MLFMNEYEIDETRQRYADHPVLGPATQTLHNLMCWTNANSDGWPYWQKPATAARRLMELIGTTQQYINNPGRDDVHADDLKGALRPIKTFRTKHSADFEIIEVGAERAGSRPTREGSTAMDENLHVAITELLARVAEMGETGLFVVITRDPQTLTQTAYGPFEGPRAVTVTVRLREGFNHDGLGDMELSLAPWQPFADEPVDLPPQP